MSISIYTILYCSCKCSCRCRCSWRAIFCH